MEKFNITWEMIFRRIKDLMGGLAVTNLLKRATIVHTPELATLIVDDLIDSGATQKHYENLYPEVDFIALFNKQSEEVLRDKWLVFPWDLEHPGKQEANIQDNIVRMLQYIGEDPGREGLKGTPDRVVRMWQEIFRGYDPKQKPKVALFNNGHDGISYDQMILDTGSYYSHCEHHMVPFFGKYCFAYIPHPDGKIIGLSKVARIVDYHAAKLQIQERLVQDIVKDLWDMLSVDGQEPLGMGLIMTGEHLCKSMRGAKKQGQMTTSKLVGKFKDEPQVRSEFLNRVSI